MDISGPVAILLFFLLLLVDMFFYGFDAAIDNLNEKEILHKAEEEKDRRSVRLSEMVSRPGIYINTVQLVITLINILMGAFYLNIWLQAIDNGLHVINVGGLSLQNVPTGVISGIATVLSFVAMIYILLTFGVLIPRKMASRKPEKWAYACIDPIFWITRLLSPLTGLVNLTAKGILFLFGVRNNVDENDVTEEEIINMVQEGHEQGVIQASEAEMISNIFEYGDKEAQDIMTHRGSIVAIDGETKLKDAIASMLEGKNSRYPVYEENIDHIIGILHLKDAMRFHISDDKLDLPIAKLDGLLREPYFVPQTKNIDELFKEMQSQKLQMVIVVDEYGQTDGLIAMEDILEEIVGNIMDEYDEDQEYIKNRGKGEYVMEGKTPLKEVEELLDITFDEEEFETLNGFLISRLDRIPEPDEQFDVDYKGYNFKILSVVKKMIGSVLVKKLPEEKTLENAEDGQSVLEEKQKECYDKKSVIAQALRIQRERNFKFKGVTKMSGHSKFANIKHKKEKNDAAKGKIFTIIGREIAVAVKEGGPDPANNFKLATVIAKAKANNMPNDTIDRGIKKAAGDVGNVNYKYVTYEGYGPNGIAIIVDALTDNTNRTAANVRSAFTKGQGNVGTPGCVSFMFDKKGQIIVDKEECDMEADDLMMTALDAGAEDFSEEEDSFEILTDPDNFEEVRKALEDAGIPMISAEVTMIPQNYVTLTDETAVKNLQRTLDLLEDDDDVQAVYHNWDE